MLSEVERKLLGVMMIVIMFGMGAGLTWRDFFSAFKKPQGLLIGVICQFGLMPIIAFGLGFFLQLPPAAAFGLLIMGCVPGGTTSNIFTYFAKGDLALSIIMTVASTVVAIVVTPLLLLFYGQHIFANTSLKIPFEDISLTLFILLVPALVGMIVRKINANLGAVTEFLGSFLGILVIVFLIVTWIPRNAGLLAVTPINVYLASFGLGVMGFLFGFLLSKLLGQTDKQAMTICLEIGIQNGPLAVAIVLFSLPKEMQDQVLLIPILYSLMIILSSSAATVFFRRWMTRLEEGKLKEAAML
jgi:BASS family bile acid:Na+ symporter